MITSKSFWMDRPNLYPDDFTPAIKANGEETICKINNLLALAERDGIIITEVASGWRPQAVNDATSNAAGHSTHISALACDLRDTSNRALAHWCVNHLTQLVLCELWMESPQYTGGAGHTPWVHLQTVPPHSNKRIYIPSSKPPFDPNFKMEPDHE